jgi:uncharacterized protein (TIGR03085 family)
MLFSSSSPSLARREREALCDLALTLGPSAPTLCEGWSVRDLFEHLLLREQPWRRRSRASVRKLPFEALVDLVHRPPTYLAVLSPVDRLLNTVEFFVHHEDVRRAQPSWSPRPLAGADEGTLWSAVSGLGRLLGLRGGTALAVTDGERSLTLWPGGDPVVVRGDIGEIVLFLYGRAQVQGLSFSGPEEKVARLRSAKLGF